MADTRRVTMATADGTVVVEERPVPDVGPGDVHVRVRASLLSPGSEGRMLRRLRRGGRREDERPMGGGRGADPETGARPLGYQVAGDVVAVGDDVDRLAPGDRVAAMGMGLAPHADAVVVPQNLCVPLPDDVTYEAGAGNHLAATGLNAVRRAAVDVGEYVAVVGLGLVGQFAAQFARIAGGRVLAVDPLGNRVEAALAAGAERGVADAADAAVPAAEALTGGDGTDCGIVAFGGDATAAVDALLAMARRGPDGLPAGRIAIVGGATVGTEFPVEFGTVDVRPASRTGPGYHDPDYERGADYPHAWIRWPVRRNLEEAVRRLATGDLLTEPLYTHRFPLAEAPAAYDLALERPAEALGVLLRPDG